MYCFPYFSGSRGRIEYEIIYWIRAQQHICKFPSPQVSDGFNNTSACLGKADLSIIISIYRSILSSCSIIKILKTKPAFVTIRFVQAFSCQYRMICNRIVFDIDKLEE
jgi:hypothetical protein